MPASPSRSRCSVSVGKHSTEIDDLWRLIDCGRRENWPIGRLKDRFGLSWQVVPTMSDRCSAHLTDSVPSRPPMQ